MCVMPYWSFIVIVVFGNVHDIMSLTSVNVVAYRIGISVVIYLDGASICT